MPLRLLEIILPNGRDEQVQEILSDFNPSETWCQDLTEEKLMYSVILPTEDSGPLMDAFEKRFGQLEDFRILLYSIEATVPRPDEGEKEEQERQDRRDRISREELYTELTQYAHVSPVFLAMTLLASIVCALGILNNDVAVIIGAMVITPLLGPNVALSLATTIGDLDLGRKSLQTNLIGIFSAFLLSAILGSVVSVDPSITELSARTQVGLGNIVLALAAGSAGALAFTTGTAAALIGVMVAVALLPPLVVFGLLVGSSQYALALGALLLFLTNLICINLSGVLTFIFQGIKPVNWWEIADAERSSKLAILVWAILLIVLSVLILFSQGVI